MKNADIRLAENARSDNEGNTGVSAMMGICTAAVSGVKMKPIAARCGSRLNKTLSAAYTRDSESPRIRPWDTCTQ